MGTSDSDTETIAAATASDAGTITPTTEPNPPATAAVNSAAAAGPLSPRAARSARAVPFLTGNPHTAHQRAGTLLLHGPVDLGPVLYSDDDEEEEDNNGEEEGGLGLGGQGGNGCYFGGASGLGGGGGGSGVLRGADGLGELAAYLPRPDTDAAGADEDGDGDGDGGKGKAPARRAAAPAPPPLPAGRGCHLVILAVPPHMVPGELLQFVSPFREEIRLMRVVRHRLPAAPPTAALGLGLGFSSSGAGSGLSRGFSSLSASRVGGGGSGGLFGGPGLGGDGGEGSLLGGGGGGGLDSRPAKYMALVEMRSQEAADALYQAFQGKPFNSLEPWLRCRLAFLQGLSFAPLAAAAPAAASASPSGGNGGHGAAGPLQKSLEQQHAALVMDIEMGPSSSASSSSQPPKAAASSSSDGELPQCVVCLESLGGLQQQQQQQPQPPSPRKRGGSGSEPPPRNKGGKSKAAATAGSTASASAAASAAAAASVAAQQVLVTACNHAFHMDCLRRLAGPLCPVCRYNHDTVAYNSSVCGECGRTTDLWVCLVCGFIGCGRYHAQHSRRHYLETLHAYAIEVQTQQVWDYVGDGYVHRLLYHKGDGHGKLVEVADPRASSRSDGQLRPRTAPPSDGEEEEMMHRKLESWAQQYTVLLSSGLEEQRRRFEAHLAELHAAHAPPAAVAAEGGGGGGEGKGGGGGGKKKKGAGAGPTAGAGAGAARVALTGEQLVAALKQERRQLEHRCLAAHERLRKVADEMGFLQELNGTLEQNQTQLKLQMREAEGELTALAAERQEQVPALERRVQELMARLDSSSADTAPHEEEEEASPSTTTTTSAAAAAAVAAVAAVAAPAPGGVGDGAKVAAAGGRGVEEAKKDWVAAGAAGAGVGPAPPPPPPPPPAPPAPAEGK